MKKDFSILLSWLIRYSMIVILIIVFPLFVLVVGHNYENKALDTVSIDTKPYVPPVSNTQDTSSMTTTEASNLQAIYATISKDWVSSQDGRYVLTITSDNTFRELYSGKKFGWGTWRIYSAIATSTIVSIGAPKNQSVFANKVEGDGMVEKYYIQRTQLDPDAKGEKYTYEIYQLNDATLVLIRSDNDKVLAFKAATGTIEVLDDNTSNK